MDPKAEFSRVAGPGKPPASNEKAPEPVSATPKGA
jgi:hypothetical protein